MTNADVGLTDRTTASDTTDAQLHNPLEPVGLQQHQPFLEDIDVASTRSPALSFTNLEQTPSGVQGFLLSPAIRFDLHSPGITPRSLHGPAHNQQVQSGPASSRLALSEIFTPRPSSTQPYEDDEISDIDNPNSVLLSDVASAADDRASHTTRTIGVDGLPGLNSSSISAADASKRLWYDDFTTIDWVHDFIKESFRVKRLRDLPGIRGRLIRARDASQGWILISVIGSVVACIAYLIDAAEQRLFDWRSGYCSTNWLLSESQCCSENEDTCVNWLEWRYALRGSAFAEYLLYIGLSVVLATLAVLITLTTASATPFKKSSILADNTADSDGSVNANIAPGAPVSLADGIKDPHSAAPTSMIYSAAGGGVAEVKTILSGFVIKKFLGSYTLVTKSVGLVLSISSGLNVGKEGPYVHIAACVGNIACRFFNKFHTNDGKRREILSAATSAGVAVAFGSPLGGVLFALEEVSYYFPPKTLIRSFLCAVISALVLKLLDPYGTGKIVIFQVSYGRDWHPFEFMIFAIVGACGGAIGAAFGRLNQWWARVFRQSRLIKKRPILEVVIMAAVTAAISYSNEYTRKSSSELLYDLARSCEYDAEGSDLLGYSSNDPLCPTSLEQYSSSIWYLSIAFVIKFVLTSMTLGLKVPSGIYVPSMVIGALFGRIVGLAVQWLQYQAPDSFIFSSCPAGEDPAECTIPGVYAIVAAGAVMAGVTRMTVTLAVILFELTGSLDHVLPISVAILVSKWVAQAIEPSSVYDIIMHNNNFPFLDNQRTPGFSVTLHDIVPKATISATSTVIDITDSPYVSAKELRTKLEVLQMSGELDGSLPILRNQVLVGLLPVPELEYALDKIKERDASAANIAYNDLSDVADSDEMMCHISADEQEIQRYYHHEHPHYQINNNSNIMAGATDLTPFVDRAPINLDINSPLAMVYLMFVRLGLRMVCVSEDGKFWGVLHKKRFIEYCRFGDDNMETWF
ncbi:chloride channel [Lipomyces arxii]|uniref:chloride channel n=1 Tax=Lipomyces arxii TaxID=56418 RepID=UPI0034CDA8E5